MAILRDIAAAAAGASDAPRGLQALWKSQQEVWVSRDEPWPARGLAGVVVRRGGTGGRHRLAGAGAVQGKQVPESASITQN